MSPSNIVTIRELSKEYRQGEIDVVALNNISLDIAQGEFLTLMGPSGSGKSTLLHIIAGIDRPTKGICRVQDIDVTKLNESDLADWRNQNVGFVFQTFNLIPVLTAFENVELPLLLTRLSAKRRREQVKSINKKSSNLSKKLAKKSVWNTKFRGSSLLNPITITEMPLNKSRQ